MPPNPKLQYDAKVPAFLQRLKGQCAGPGERSHVQQARPRKEIIDHEDDGPTYVDEHSNETISREDFDKMAAADATVEDDTQAKATQALGGTPNTEKAEEKDQYKKEKAVFGASSKRKIARVIGDEDSKPEALAAEKADDDVGKSGQKKMKKAGKKGKKIKLSFDEEGEEEA